MKPIIAAILAKTANGEYFFTDRELYELAVKDPSLHDKKITDRPSQGPKDNHENR